MYLRLTSNLLHFLPDLGALYAVHPTIVKSTPGQYFEEDLKAQKGKVSVLSAMMII
jgi:hypothetical protein